MTTKNQEKPLIILQHTHATRLPNTLLHDYNTLLLLCHTFFPHLISLNLFVNKIASAYFILQLPPTNTSSMGVTGLLQHLKEIQEPSNLASYKGKTLAVDTYGWLHRGLISCAQELCQNQPTRKYVNSVIKKVDMLRHFGVEPYLVFDGAYLPTKAETAKERRIKREEAQQKADLLLKRGDRKLAWKEFMKAAGVTPEMAKSIMVELDARKVKYVVAPYEADPQMVYLEKIGAVDGILSEDSDLLIFGCQRLITKLNDYGECVVIDRANFPKVKKIPQLSSYTQQQLRLVAMLAGCDYTKGIPGIGLKTAFTLVWKHGDLNSVLSALDAEGKVPDTFADEVFNADLAFQFQKVFDPFEKSLKTLNEYPSDLGIAIEKIEACCGQTLDGDLHYRICRGHVHPNTHEPLISREHNITLKSKSMTVETTSTRKTSIEQYFSSNMVQSTPKKSALTSAIQKVSPVSKKILKVISSARSPQALQTSKFFVKATSQKETQVVKSLQTKTTISEPTRPRKLEPVSDSSLMEDSDLPDEFSSPFKMKVMGTMEEVDTDEDREEVKKAALADFDVNESDDDIQESPVKSTHLASVGKLLRQHYLCGSESVVDKQALLGRRPLQAIDHNKKRTNEDNTQKTKRPKPSGPVQLGTTKLQRFAFTR